jgi:hypothetical protein
LFDIFFIEGVDQADIFKLQKNITQQSLTNENQSDHYEIQIKHLGFLTENEKSFCRKVGSPSSQQKTAVQIGFHTAFFV